MSEKVQITIKNKVGEKYADLQTKVVTPTNEAQIITADDGYYGLKEVIVNPPEIDGQAILDKVDEISQSLTESYMGGNATRKDILEGKEAYVKGKKVQGVMEKYLGTNKIELQKDEVGSYTLLTANKYVDSDINVEIVEKKTTPYDYFKDILDNDIGPEDFPYKCMIVIPFFITDDLKLNSGTFKMKINDEIVSQNTLDCSSLKEIEVFDSIYNQNTKFKYVIFYRKTIASASDFLFPYELVTSVVYCIGSDNNLDSFIPYKYNYYSYIYFRKTNLINNCYVYSFYNDNRNYIEDDNITIKISRGATVQNLFASYTHIRGTLFVDNTDNTGDISISYVEAKKIILKEKASLYTYLTYPHFNPDVLNDLINFKLDISGFNPINSNFLNLINVRFYDIKYNVRIGYNSYIGKNLTYESIIHTIRELINTGSSHTLEIGSYNKLKIQDTYVKLLDVTSEMIEEDEYAVQKKPFAICDKEDEGAMTLDEYVALKNWKIA